LRQPAKEDGYYVVLEPARDEGIDDATLTDAALLLKLEPAELARIVSAGQPLPLTRTPTLDEAQGTAEGLSALRIQTVIVPNDDLHLDLSPKKIRALEPSDDSLTGLATGTDAKVTVGWSEITLVVTGRLLSNRVEIEERRGRGRSQTVDSRQLSADESVLDLYAKSQEANWRILAGSFDFSCLGTAKSVTTFQNFSALTNFLRERAPGARFDDAYARTRAILETVWPLEPEVKKGEWRRRGTGKFDTTTATVTDNEPQFTRYSRLRHCLRLRELENAK
jgi:hypothetical protein